MSSRAASVPLRRVLLSSWEYDPNIVGGMGRHVTELIQAMGEELPDSTYEIHLLTPACPKAPEYEKIGERAHVHRFPWPGQERGDVYDDTQDLVGHTLELNRQLLVKAGELADQGEFHLVHAHDWLTTSSALELSQAWQVPLVSTFHATEKGRHYGHIVNELNRQIHQLEATLCQASVKAIECSHYMRDSLIGLWLALSVYTGAFIAEIVRAGILAISKGQTEAAYALGLRPGRAMSLVVLPQALRVIVPPLISQFLNLTKNSSLAIAVGYMDATGTLGGITLNQTGREMECILLLMAFYLVTSLAISGAMNAYNRRASLKER